MGCGVIQRWGLNSESGKLCLSVVPNWVPSGHCSPVLCFCVWLWHFCLSFHAYFWFPSAFHHPIPSPCLNAVLSWSAVPRLFPYQYHSPLTLISISALYHAHRSMARFHTDCLWMTIFCRLCVSAFLSLAVLSQKFYTLVWCVHVVVSRCTGFGRFVLAALFNFLLFAPTLILSISQLGYIDVLQNTYHPAQARILFYSYHIINQYQ